jgi:hypothetical protein
MKQLARRDFRNLQCYAPHHVRDNNTPNHSRGLAVFSPHWSLPPEISSSRKAFFLLCVVLLRILKTKCSALFSIKGHVFVLSPTTGQLLVVHRDEVHRATCPCFPADSIGK